MSRTAQTAKKKSKRQQGADPDPVAIYKSPAKEVKRLLQAYPVEQTLQKKRKTTMSGRYDQMGRRREVKAAMSGRRRQPTRDTSAE